MAFRPFGFAFEIGTPLNSIECKRRIRQCKQAWYNPNNGPRGFILGRFICLWNSLYQSDGPMLIGWIHDDGIGCRISGRSGSDINGALLWGLAGVFLPIIVYGLSRDGQMNLAGGGMLGLTAIALVLLLWNSSRERGAGLTLTDFVGTTLGTKAQNEFS